MPQSALGHLNPDFAGCDSARETVVSWTGSRFVQALCAFTLRILHTAFLLWKTSLAISAILSFQNVPQLFPQRRVLKMKMPQGSGCLPAKLNYCCVQKVNVKWDPSNLLHIQRHSSLCWEFFCTTLICICIQIFYIKLFFPSYFCWTGSALERRETIDSSQSHPGENQRVVSV